MLLGVNQDNVMRMVRLPFFSFIVSAILALSILVSEHLVRKEGRCLTLPSSLLPSIINVILKITAANDTDHLFYFMEFNFLFRLRSF